MLSILWGYPDVTNSMLGIKLHRKSCTLITKTMHSSLKHTVDNGKTSTSPEEEKNSIVCVVLFQKAMDISVLELAISSGSASIVQRVVRSGAVDVNAKSEVRR